MDKVAWQGGALLGPIPAVMVSCGDMESSKIITVAWCGITNTIPPKTYISLRPSRYSYDIIKKLK
jgi:flavin reductase (DIM6/NTAB) family NADH-FMN oxidoreductase RutF